jgi:hypothetical protein
MEGCGLERAGDIRSHLSAGEERLRVPGGNDLELTVVVELADGEKRVPCGRRAEGERMFELVSLGLRRPAPRKQPVRVLTGYTELCGQVRDRQPLPPEQRLPDVGFIPHGRRS